MRAVDQTQDWALAQEFGIFDPNSELGRAALLAFEADRRARSEHYKSHTPFVLLSESVAGPWPFVLLRPELGPDQLGLFASRAYKKGERILEYMGKKKYVNSIEETQGVFVFTVQEKNGRCCVIDPSDQGGLARYANQTVRPNMRYELQDGQLWLIANKDISGGEEISGQYGDNNAALEDLRPSSAWIYFLRHILLNSEQKKQNVLERLGCSGGEFANAVMNCILDLVSQKKLPVLPRKFSFGLAELKALLASPALVQTLVAEQSSAMDVDGQEERDVLELGDNGQVIPSVFHAPNSSCALSFSDLSEGDNQQPASPCVTPRRDDVYRYEGGASAMPNLFSPVQRGKKGVDPVPPFSFDFYSK